MRFFSVAVSVSRVEMWDRLLGLVVAARLYSPYAYRRVSSGFLTIRALCFPITVCNVPSVRAVVSEARYVSARNGISIRI
jgi:hypothetical protein